MKKILFNLMAMLIAAGAFAQTDSTKVENHNDTIRIGGMIILKKGDHADKKQVTVTMGNRRKVKTNSNISTSSFIVDLGFANWIDKTNYANAANESLLVTKPGSPELVANDFKSKTVKSVNVNIWFFMQRLNLVKHYVNLKYGVGVELNNYRFKSDISFKEGGLNPYNSLQNIPHPFVFKDSIGFSKNKLAADYLTIPVMLNLRTNKNYSDKGISLSGGVSVGYLYSSRNKQVSSDRGKQKNRGDYDLETWKFSYIAELGLGPAHLYGTYTPKSMFSNGLDFRPYSVGIRLSNW